MTEPKLQERLRKRVLYGDARLHNPAGHDPLSMEAADALDAAGSRITGLEAMLTDAQAEVERLQDRLEMRHAWQFIDGQKVRVQVEPGSIPDGIDCRNETIKLQDERIASLKAEVERLREALSLIANLDDAPAQEAAARAALGRTP